MSGVLALDFGDAGLVSTFPPARRKQACKGARLGERIRDAQGWESGSSSVPELRVFSSMPLLVSGCCLCVFPL